MIAFNDVGLRWLVNGKGTDLYGLTHISPVPHFKFETFYRPAEMNKGQSFISVTWVINQKHESEDMYYKARLVARGFEESNLTNIRKDSVTYCMEKFRWLLAIVVTKKWKVHLLDIISAFLQGKNIDRVNISVYGLCDAPRVWYLSLKSVLEKCGAKKSKYDDAVLYLYDNNNLQGILCALVDDFCWGGTEQLEAKIMKLIKKSFRKSLEELETFKYLGLNVEQTCGYIKIEQSSYINELKEVDIILVKNKNTLTGPVNCMKTTRHHAHLSLCAKSRKTNNAKSRK